MEALFLLIAISLLVALGFLAAFVWAVRSKQFEDDFTPSVRMLFEQPAGSEGLSESKTSVQKKASNED